MCEMAREQGTNEINTDIKSMLESPLRVKPMDLSDEKKCDFNGSREVTLTACGVSDSTASWWLVRGVSAGDCKSLSPGPVRAHPTQTPVSDARL